MAVPADLRTLSCCPGGDDGSELSDGLREQGHAVGSDRWQRRREPGRCYKYWNRDRPLVASGPQVFLCSLVLSIVTGSFMFWDFGSLFLPACNDQTAGIVPALTVTSGGRDVGSDVACSGKSSRGRERHGVWRRGRPDSRNRKRGCFRLRKLIQSWTSKINFRLLRLLAGGCRFGSGPCCSWGRCRSLWFCFFSVGSNHGRSMGTDPRTGSDP